MEDKKRRRLRMLKDLGLVCFCDFLTSVILAAFLFRNTNEVFSCSKELFGVGLGLFVYQFFFFARNLLIMTCCFCAKKPDDSALLCRMAFSCIDWTGLSAFVIWATIIMTKPLTEECRVQSSGIASWWTCCIVCLVFFWVYVACVCCVCNLLCPLFSFFFGFLVCYGRNQATERAERLRNQVPIANSLIEKLNLGKKRFTDLTQTQKAAQESCIICFETFTE